MNRLTPADYPLLLPLFTGMDNHLPVHAALAGSVTAVIYADNPVRPRIALISVHHRRLYLAGQPDAAAARAVAGLFREILYPAMERDGVPVFSLCVTPAEWEAHLDVLLAGRPPIRTGRQYYEYAAGPPLTGVALPSALLPSALLPAGYGLRAAGAGLLAETGLANLDALREEMTSERASVEDFLAHSFGLCPVTEDALVGWCLSEYNTGDRCEVGIATLPPHQGRGLATATGAAFVSQAAARGVTRIGWHCYADNRPSWATALKIGFQKVEDYPAYLVWNKALKSQR